MVFFSLSRDVAAYPLTAPLTLLNIREISYCSILCFVRLSSITALTLEKRAGAARIETDEERPYFLLDIPCRDGFENLSILNATKSELKSELKIMEYVFTLIKKDPKVTIPSMILESGKSRTTI